MKTSIYNTRLTAKLHPACPQVPEPRQGHVAGLLGSGDHYYMVVTGERRGRGFGLVFHPDSAV